MLQRFYADNFRCLVNFEVKLGGIQLLVGDNGSGKSSFLDALDAIRELVIDAVPCAKSFGRKTRTRWQEMELQHFELDFACGPAQLFSYRLTIADSFEHQPRVASEALDLNGTSLFRFEGGEMQLFSDAQPGVPKVKFHRDWHRSGLAEVAPRPENQSLTSFKGWLERLRPVQINPWEMSERSEAEAPYPSRRLGNLADWYRHLQQENHEIVAAAIESLREALPGFWSLNARKAGLDYREVLATMQGPSGNEFEVTLRELSEGQRCVIGLYLLLHAVLARGGSLIIDEPENFIALAEIQPWLMRAIGVAEDRAGQLVVVSHHPELLNQLAARGGLMLTREHGGPTRVKPFPESELPPAELVARGWEKDA